MVTNYSTSGDGSIKVTGIDKYDDAADVVGFDDVAKGDFVLAIEYGGKLYVEVPETVTGDLQSFSISKATVKLDETTYDISDIVASVNGADKETYAIYDYLNEDNILGTTATYYLDNNGYVVAVCDADETYGNYAVILSKQAYEAGSGTSLGKDARVKVLLADGTIDTYEADVILADGTIETITIDSTTFEAIQHDDGGMKVNAGMYRYSVSDDVYSLKTTAADGLVISGTITATRSDYITVGDSYTLTSDTIVAYGATNKTASVGEALNRGDKVAFVINEDDEVEFAVITAYAADEYEVAITGSDASNKLTYMVNDEEKTLEDGNLAVGTVLTVEAEAENMVVVDVNGNKTYLEDGDEYTLTAADTTFEVVAKPTVTLSGTSADAASVTATYSSIDGTAYMPGDEVEVVLTLSGTADAGNTVTVSVDGAEGTYTSDIETEGVVVNATSGVVISAETEVDGTVTFTFVVGAEDVTLTVGVVAVV